MSKTFTLLGVIDAVISVFFAFTSYRSYFKESTQIQLKAYFIANFESLRNLEYSKIMEQWFREVYLIFCHFFCLSVRHWL